MAEVDAMLEAVLFEDAEDDVIDAAIDDGSVDLSDNNLEEDRFGISPDQENDIDQLAGIDADDVNAVDPDEDEEYYDTDFIVDEEEDIDEDEDVTAEDIEQAIDSDGDEYDEID